MELNLKKYPAKKNSVKYIPQTAGAYIFFKNNKPIYIGKAINLKKRISSYYSKAIFGKTLIMVNKATNISFIKVNSEFEALLLEANLIKNYKPKYNFELKDDKNPIYIKITKEKYPRILLIRKPKNTDKNIYGPYPSKKTALDILRYLRKIFPFSDHNLRKIKCIYSQIGLCNPCPNYIESISDKNIQNDLRKIYIKNINNIKKILSGRLNYIKNSLNREMLSLSKRELYEEANLIKNRIELLDNISKKQFDINEYLLNPNFYDDIRNKEVEELLNILKDYINIYNLNRIECYDVSHISGENSAASMVTFIKGEPEKRYYRLFKIKIKIPSDDISSLKEVIERRLKHINDWGKPDLIVVDGGKSQVNAFNKFLKAVNIPVIGLAKRYEKLIIPYKSGFVEYIPEGYAKNIIQRIRNEAHRFARNYHNLMFKKSLINKN